MRFGVRTWLLDRFPARWSVARWMAMVGCAAWTGCGAGDTVGGDGGDEAPGICEGGGDDPYNSSDPALMGETLHLGVAYSGGCRRHDFAPCWDETFAARDGLLFATVRIAHDANGDYCESGLGRPVEISLEAIADAWRLETGQQAGALFLGVTLVVDDKVPPSTVVEVLPWTLE